jgi:hypothetical protein
MKSPYQQFKDLRTVHRLPYESERWARRYRLLIRLLYWLVLPLAAVFGALLYLDSSPEVGHAMVAVIYFTIAIPVFIAFAWGSYHNSLLVAGHLYKAGKLPFIICLVALTTGPVITAFLLVGLLYAWQALEALGDTIGGLTG